MPFDIEKALQQMRTGARIDEDPRGGPMRTIINGRHRKPTGRYYSAKARRSLPWEDIRERAYFWHCEADANVVTYLSQPHRLSIDVGRPRPLIYFPDVRRIMANGRVQIREVKKEYDPDRDPDYDLKLTLAREVYAGLGWDFAIVQAPEIEQRQTLETVWAIQRRRNLAVMTHHRFAVAGLLERQGGTAPFQAVADALGGGPVGEALVCACIVRRVLSIDITARLAPWTPVTLVTGSPDSPRGSRGR